MNGGGGYNSFYEAFQATANSVPDKVALIFLGTKISYSQLLDHVESLAASLSKTGVGEGDRTIIYLSNCPQWVIAWLALLRLNAVPVPITAIYTPSDIRFIAEDAGAKAIIGLDTNFGYVKRILPEVPLETVVVTSLLDLLPLGKRLFCRALNRGPTGKYILDKNVYSFRDFLKNANVTLPAHRANPKGLAGLLYTGGTTGRPKGVPISNALFLHRTKAIRDQRNDLVPRGEDVMIQGVPLFHAFGMLFAGGALSTGETIVLYPRVNMDGILDHVKHNKVRTLFGVPAFYRMILDHERVDYYDLSSIKYCLSAGDVLPLEVEERWYNKYKTILYQGYGATETGAAVTIGVVGEEQRKGSAGKLMPFQSVKLVEHNSTKPVPDGQPGEILVSSENMVEGYWNNPEETEKCFVKLDGKLWYRTGDIVRVDEDGWLFFLDRTSDMIKHKGYRIAASEIEKVLQENPAVVDSCVVGVPDEKVGERIKAFVVLKEDVRGVTAYDLLKWCRGQVVSYKVPQYIEFRDMLPKSKVGKLLRREVRDEELRKL